MSKEVKEIVLSEIREGICLSKPHGAMIYSGEQSSIVLSKLFKSKINSLIYIIEDNLCYGVIRLLSAFKITKNEFKELSESHQITNIECDKWWPTKEILFSYDFETLETFSIPKKVNIELCNIDTFIDTFEFSSEKEMIQGNVKEYDAEKLKTESLKDDWRIVCAWYSSKKENKKVKHSLEDIINLAKLIYTGLDSRGIKINPEHMNAYGKELYKRVSGESSIDLNNPELLSELKDKLIIKDFISVVGSYAEGKNNPHDVDILIRMKEPTPFIKRAIETRFLKDVGWTDKVHFIWGDSEGPHDTFVPLYDLQLKRINPLRVVKMQETELVDISPFYPMKPSKRFYQIDDIIPFMFKLSNKFAIEKKFNGFRVIVIKSGNNIKIYSDNKKDITENLPTIYNETKKLTNKDFIIDGELVYKNGGRSHIINFFITEKKDMDDSLLTLHVFDLTSFNGNDICNEPFSERKNILHQFNFQNHIKEVYSLIVDSDSAARKAISFTRHLPESEGAMVKVYEGKYVKNGTTNAWIKFRNEDPLSVQILEIEKKSNGYVYLIGINVKDDKDKFEPDYLDGDMLKLGHTFVTDKLFKQGDLIIVNVEEVWKHIYAKHKIRFSIHKPKVIDKSYVQLTSWRILDDLAVSKGESVNEFCEECQMSEREIEVENHVVKKGDKWCVVHGHPMNPGSKADKPIGSVIKCFPNKEDADAMHKAIIISEAKRAGKMSIPTDDTTRQYDYMAQAHNDEVNIGKDQNYNPITGERLDGGGSADGVTSPGGIRGGGTVEGDIADVQGKVWQKKKVIAAPTFNPIKPSQHVDNMPAHDKRAGLPPGLQDTFSGIGEKKTFNPIVPVQAWYGLADEENHEGSEGGEYMIIDFPERMQRAFTKLIELNQWKDFTMQWHLRGTKSIHTDLRLDVGDNLEGFTLFTPGGIDGDDLITEQPHNIRSTIKLPQPTEWLKVHGGFKKGLPGTTTNHDAYFAIVAKGKYRPIEISDHVIKIELASDHGAVPKVAPINDEDRDYVDQFNQKLPENRKELNGYFSFHIAHIEDKHIILFDKVHSS